MARIGQLGREGWREMGGCRCYVKGERELRKNSGARSLQICE
jgi:hypothetical protein